MRWFERWSGSWTAYGAKSSVGALVLSLLQTQSKRYTYVNNGTRGSFTPVAYSRLPSAMMLAARAVAVGVRKHSPARCQAVLQGAYRNGQQCRHSACDGLYCRKHTRMAEQAAAEEEEQTEKCSMCYACKPRDIFLPCSTCNQELHLPCLLKWQADGGVVKCPFCNSGLSPRASWYVNKSRLRNAVETRAAGMTPEVSICYIC